MNWRYLSLLCLAVFGISSAVTYKTPSLASGPGGPRMESGAPTADTNVPASITGLVTLEGQPPKPAPINMAQEPACAKLHPTQAVNSDVIVGLNGSLENVVVYISAGLEGRTFEPPAQPVVIDQKGCVYQPHVIALQTNQKLEVVNSDPTMHNIHPIPSNNREWNKSQPPTMPPIIASFAREEIAIPVKCNVHPWMRSYIAVFSHPYFAVTGKNGDFALKNLPPGTYSVTAWHEKLGKSEQKVTVAASESKSLKFVFKAKAY